MKYEIRSLLPPSLPNILIVKYKIIFSMFEGNQNESIIISLKFRIVIIFSCQRTAN